MEIVYKDTEELLETLRAQAVEMDRYFQLSEPDLSKTYAVGKWSVRELLHHLADAETVLYERIRRGIAHPGQVIWGFNQDSWANNLGYAARDLEINRSIFQAVRRGVIDLAETYYSKAGAQQYVHNETGLRTVKEEFDKVAWHNEHHLRQIRKALN